LPRTKRGNFRTGRFVDPDYVLNGVGTKPTETFYNIYNNPYFISYDHYSNYVPKGQEPKLVTKGKNKLE